MKMSLIKTVVDVIKNIRRKSQQRKYNYIFKLGYRYFYDIQKPLEVVNDVNIPEFLHEFKRKNLAAYLTTRQMKKIVDSNSLNHCYKSAKKFAKLHNISA